MWNQCDFSSAFNLFKITKLDFPSEIVQSGIKNSPKILIYKSKYIFSGKKSVQLPIEYKTKIRYIISAQGNPCVPQRLTTWASFQLKSEKKILLTTVERQLSN